MSYVYIIQNTLNGNIYIGKANNVQQRWYAHKHNFQKEKHPTTYLYRAFAKYGINNFIIDTLECCSTSEEALEAEKWWINYFKSIGANLYNLTPGGEGIGRPKGFHCSDQTKSKIGKKNRKHMFRKRLSFDNDVSHHE